jgi:hydroxyquinol 1,2-dioxygenase
VREFTDEALPARFAGRGWLRSGMGGECAFWSVRPSRYPATRILIMHIFAAGDQYLDSDALFGVTESPVVEFAAHPAGAAPDGRVLDTAWASLNFDIVLEARP